jgi:uncharacterized repeat protein (TIGR01451 family)
VIDANAAGRALKIALGNSGNVSLANLTIRNGNATSVDPALALGGGISWSACGGSLTINGSVIDSNSTSIGDGGGIAAVDVCGVQSAQLVINNSTISSNTAVAGAGGGVYVGQQVALVMSACTVQGNRAGNPATNFGQGGGVFIYGPAGSASSSITGGAFNSNAAAGDGGAIYTTAPLTVSTTYGSDSSANSAGGNGPNLWDNANGAFRLPNAAATVTAGGTLTFTENDPATVIDSGITIQDGDNTNLLSATVSISSGLVPSNDLLGFTNRSNINGVINGSYNSATGVLTLTGLATREEYQAALRSVTFRNAADFLPVGPNPRTVSFKVNDGVNDSNTATSTVNVVGVNDSPLLQAASPLLTAITEDDTGNAGHTVNSIIGATITDADYNPSTSGLRGIAIVAANPGNSTWQYSVDSGATWNDLGTVTATSALLLRSGDYIRFLPNAMNGTSATFTYRAWDQSDGANAGTREDAANTGGSSPFSIGSNTASIAVSSVNDAPGFVGGITNLTVVKDSGAADIGALLHSGDPDLGQTETWTVTGAPTHGTLDGFPATAASGSFNIAPAGTLTYTPTAGYAGSDSFTIQVSDGTALASRTIAVAVTVPPTIAKAFGADTILLNGTTNLTLTITNPNTGITLTGIAFTDSLPAGLVVAPTPGLSSTCGGSVSGVAGSGSVSLSGGELTANTSCTVSANVMGTTPGSKNNSVTVTSTEGGTGNTANATLSVIAPATHFSVSAPATATAEEAFNFTVTALDQFENTVTSYTGTVHFTSSDSAAVLPSDATLTSGAGTFSATLWTAGSRTITATDTVSSSVTGTSGVINVTRSADLALSKSAPETAVPLIDLTYAITQSNYGPNTAQEVIVTDTLPAGTTFVSVSAGGSNWAVSTPAVGANGTVTCSKSSVAAGESSNFLITVRIEPGLTNGTTISNTANITSQTTDPNLANNTATASSIVSDPVRVELPTFSYFATLASAYTNASSPNTIDAWGIEFAEALTCNLGKTITLKGGYDTGFLSNSSYTTIGSPLTVISGQLILDRIVVK